MKATDKLYQILEDISNHKHSQGELMTLQVEGRLQNALNAYIRSLEDSYSYLKTKDQLGLLKKINRGR